jgi:hypothetical protein
MSWWAGSDAGEKEDAASSWIGAERRNDSGAGLVLPKEGDRGTLGVGKGSEGECSSDATGYAGPSHDEMFDGQQGGTVRV